MDVLHFLKMHHEAVRTALDLVDAAEGVKARRAAVDDLACELQVQLTLEKDFLYPEIGGLFPGADALAGGGLASGVTIAKRLKLALKLAHKPVHEQGDLDKRLIDLKAAVIQHIDQQELLLMPKMREFIRTEDREDLGQVFLDTGTEIRADLTEAASLVPRRRA